MNDAVERGESGESVDPVESVESVEPIEPIERDSRGILHPAAGMQAFTLERFAPAAPVARFVDRYWLSSWDLPEGRRYDSQVLTHPVVNVVFEEDSAVVSGVQ